MGRRGVRRVDTTKGRSEEKRGGVERRGDSNHQDTMQLSRIHPTHLLSSLPPDEAVVFFLNPTSSMEEKETSAASPSLSLSLSFPPSISVSIAPNSVIRLI
jgi:hypothetical protein